MEFTDTHCHLYFEQLAGDLEAVIEAAKKAGVTRLICVGISLEDSRKSIEIARKYGSIWAAVGVHPHEAEGFLKNGSATEEFKALLKAPKVVAIGEIGLDYYKNRSSQRAQQKALEMMIEASIGAKLPYIFHVRDAWSDFWEIYDKYKNLTGVIHSFSSGNKQLNAALERKLFIGLNGIMTFTRDHAQLDAARQVPLTKLLLETDAPFLAPAEFRGQVCEPKHVVSTAEFLADLRGEALEELSRTTTDNAVRLFNLK